MILPKLLKENLSGTLNGNREFESLSNELACATSCWRGNRIPSIIGVDQVSDEFLNDAFLFEGYEGRTREAIRDVVIALTSHPDPAVRDNAHFSLFFFASSLAPDFLLRGIFEEDDDEKRHHAYALLERLASPKILAEQQDKEFLANNPGFSLESYIAHRKQLFKPETLNLFIERAFSEKDQNLFKLHRIIHHFLKEMPEENEQVVRKIAPLLEAGESSVRTETAWLFFDINTPESVDLGVKAMIAEKNEADADTMFTHLIFNSSCLKTLAADEKKFAAAFAQFIDAHAEGFAARRMRPNMFFSLVIPMMKEVDRFAASLSDKTRSLFLELAAEISNSKMVLRADLTSTEYFRAGATGRLIEAEVLGSRFRYFIMPQNKMTESCGMVNMNAIAISDAVPEMMRPIVGYHEYIEGQTISHRKAVKAEKKAALSLGLEQEYKAWMRSNGWER